MAKRKKPALKEPSMHRWVPDPHKRDRVFVDKKNRPYSRKALPRPGAEPSDFLAA